MARVSNRCPKKISASKKSTVMAVCEIWDVRGRLDHPIDYAENPEKTANPKYTEADLQAMVDVMEYATNKDKTEQRYFVTGVNCDPTTARDEMMIAKAQWNDESEIVCYHGFQSFKHGEVTPEQAHEVGVKLAQKMWGDRFQVIVATHLNTDCLHNHFVVNSVSFTDGNIAEIVEQAQAEDGNAPEVPLTEEENILTEYGELYLKNTDMVGWLSIAGTTLNYPVMQTPNEPNYYLKHNFEKEYSDLGTPYIQENCDLTGSDNLVIYGHHINGGKMFGALEDYKSQSFYEEHKTIQFDTLTQRGVYEIIAVFKTVAYSSQGFRYYDFVNAESEDEFNDYIQKCKELALYETGVTAEYGDRLITLSTCEYSAQNGRLVVVAKKTA